MRHTIVLSYFSQPEAERYKTLARVLATWPRPTEFETECLICTVGTGVPEDRTLHDAMSALMPTRSYRCSTTVEGYPQRPTAMFWEIMEHVGNTHQGDGSFALWLEADMVPARPTWLDELHHAWTRHQRPLVMGRLQPRTYVPTSRLVTSPHINGGACYAKSYGREIPEHAKQGVFDGTPWPEVRRSQRYVATELFAYSSVIGLANDMTSRAAVLHGYRQDKPAFYAAWAALATNASTPRPSSTGQCCDLRARHLFLDYCPLHSERTPAFRVANFVSVCAAVPYLALRRRWRMLVRKA
jgi:hypothetical protein